MKIRIWGWLLVATIGIFFLWRIMMFAGIENLSPESFLKMRKKHPGPLIDVREPHEFQSGHLSDAINIPLSQVNQITKKWDKDEPLYLYCRSGSRSAIAARQLKKAGYKVYNLHGGIQAWPYPLSS